MEVHMDMKGTRIVATACSGCQNCPVVEYDAVVQVVKVYDPEKPERGVFMMTPEEWNRIMDTATRIS